MPSEVRDKDSQEEFCLTRSPELERAPMHDGAQDNLRLVCGDPRFPYSADVRADRRDEGERVIGEGTKLWAESAPVPLALGL